MRTTGTAATTTGMETRRLVADYINFRLQKQGLRWSTCPELPAVPTKVERAMRLLGEEFETRYTEVFQEMCNQLHITPNNAQPTFVAIVNELFSDGIKWGRIVALFSFGGALAVQCVEKEMPPLVDNVVEWVAIYVDSNLQSWIQENGGWVGTIFIITTIFPSCLPSVCCAFGFATAGCKNDRYRSSSRSLDARYAARLPQSRYVSSLAC